MHAVFQELYEKYHQDVYQFLFYMVKNKEQAEDLVQEVYIKVLRSYDRFEGKSSEKTWLFSIAKHVAIDSFRKQKGWKNKLLETFDWNKQQVKDVAPLPEEVAVKNEQVQLLYRCLDKCKMDHRIVLILRYIQALSIQETAQVLGWSESKVKTTQHRAVKALKAHMEELEEKGGNSNAS
ncbi:MULTISPECIES: RNA polymerase sigma factor SigX [Sutcliffiella]|uniref:RNA polymerase sigma factor n=1 Tax=Sutcliffiella cohnii TaxID=33932 RepID=A0A223KS36_9BACI|nr:MULTISPECIES: RNA polymerase sigma factor SigX [Sutcliffiella]AST92289.1 RNA polymerase sigma factor SigX [Sutcliffiella cohnii]MED4017251.1 RNA polymerase sigma factor SigX [Sutcliffiella cohnii]WBL13520.1 RNA polymerase sigma factor SigX [Sutcliffiella sp. NC1]